MQYEITPPMKLSLNIGELIRYRELFYFFTWRDIKVKYKQTFLGFAWAVIQPFMMMVVLTMFFGKFLGVPSDGIPYPVFVFSGLMIWNIFAAGLAGAGNSMVTNEHIIKKIYFPRLIIPISSVLVALFDFLMAFLVFVGLLIFFQHPVVVWKLALLLPLSIALTVTATLGLGFLLAAMNVKYRDFRYVIPYLVQVTFFVTPVIYPITSIPEGYEWASQLMAFNPMAGAITLSKAALVEQAVDWNLVLCSAISAAILFACGLVYFRKTEAYFADLA